MCCLSLYSQFFQIFKTMADGADLDIITNFISQNKHNDKETINKLKTLLKNFITKYSNQEYIILI